MQNLSYGIALWIPFFGTGINALDLYAFRSQMAPAVVVTWDLRRRDLDYDLLRRLVAQWRQVSSYYYGDYYPLTPYSPQDDVWMAWQFDRPDLGQGMFEAFRRPKSPCESARFRLRDLDPAARYKVWNLDGGSEIEETGRELMEKGIPVLIGNQPGTAIFTYQQVRRSPLASLN